MQPFRPGGVLSRRKGGVRQAEAAHRHVALLRGVNVGANKLPMKELSAIFRAAGCGDVQTYIQSGNVVFSATPGIVGELAAEIGAEVTKRFGFQTPVILRTGAQFGETLKNNPFLKTGTPEEMLHVMFLADSPNPHAVGNLDPDRSPDDAFMVRGREIYLRLPNGVARSKLTNDYFDRKLETISTARNWRTVTRLSELLLSIDGCAPLSSSFRPSS